MTLSAPRVVVVGGGLWGRALSQAAARAKARVGLVTRREVVLHEGVERVPIDAVTSADLCVVAVPSHVIETVAEALGAHLSAASVVLHGVRGLVGAELSPLSSVLSAKTPVQRIGALGGPVLSEELAIGAPSVMVVGSRFHEVIALAREAFVSETLRLYSTRDMLGLEWASALTGCYALAVGYAQGKHVGPGLIAAFITRAVHEASRIAFAAGGDKATLLGLGGLGDMLAAAGQNDRPEIRLGRALAQGRSVDEALRELGQHIEALELLPKLVLWTKTRSVRAPILHALWTGLLAGKDHEELVRTLMVAEVVDE